MPAFAFTDIQGSSRLWDCLGPSFAPLLAEHNRIVREAAAARRGRVVRSEGDSFLVAFDEAASAAAFALAVQENLAKRGWPPEAGELLVRIGVDDDEARCVAIGSAAHGGQILATQPSGDAVVADLGMHRIEGGNDPVRLFQLLPRSLSHRRFPPPRTLDALPTNLPPDATRFFGRAKELDELAALLPSPAGRLVTLSGPAGIGKSRLAREAARRVLREFAGGCWWAELSEAKDTEGVAQSVAQALGVPLAGRENAVKTVGDVLGFRKPLLVVLDGAEHLVGGLPSAVGPWMREARNTRFLVTSRALLGISGERDVPVPALPVPRGSLDVASVALFADRAAAASPGFALGPANEKPVAEICAALEGIPLSIELAAARLRDLPPERIARELRESLAVLDAAGPSLSSALEWSWKLLPPAEQAALAQLAVFRGGFSLEAAEAVVDLAGQPDEPLVIDAVQALRDKSLLSTEDAPGGTRFSMYRPVREFAEAKRASGDAAARHARWMAAWGEEWSARLKSPRSVEAVKRLELERDNLRAAQDRAPDAATAARAALALSTFLSLRGPIAERVARLDFAAADPAIGAATLARIDVERGEALWALGDWGRGLAVDEEAVAKAAEAGLEPLRLRAMAGLAYHRLLASQYDACDALLDVAIPLARNAGEKAALATLLSTRGILLDFRGRRDESAATMVEGVAVSRQVGDPHSLVRDLGTQSLLLKNASRYPEALAIHFEAERIASETGHLGHLATLIANKGTITLSMGRVDDALACFERSEQMNRELGRRPHVALQVGNRGATLGSQGRFEEALPLLQHAIAEFRAIGDRARVARHIGLLGNAYDRHGDREKALECYEEAETAVTGLGMPSEIALWRTHRGSVLRKLKRPQEAREALASASAIDAEIRMSAYERFRLLADFALVERDLGNLAESARRAREAILAAEQNPDALDDAGEVLLGELRRLLH